MKKETPVWIGCYNEDLRQYQIETLTEMCESNVHLCKTGLGGFAPLCFGSSKEEVSRQLDSFKTEKEQLFMEFESVLVDYVSDLVDEDADVRIEEADNEEEGDAYLKDGITIIPKDKEGDLYPVASINSFFRMFYANPMGVETVDEAIEYVSREVADTLMEMWENAPERCPSCEEKNHSEL